MDSKNTAQHPIFISHSSKDKTYARKLENELRNRDFNVWVDDQQLRRSIRWPAELEQAIKACSVLIVILTPNVSDSDAWVYDEIAVAKKLGKPIIRLLLEGKEYFSLASSQYTDVTNGQIPPEMFFETLKPQEEALDLTLITSSDFYHITYFWSEYHFTIILSASSIASSVPFVLNPYSFSKLINIQWSPLPVSLSNAVSR